MEMLRQPMHTNLFHHSFAATKLSTLRARNGEQQRARESGCYWSLNTPQKAPLRCFSPGSTQNMEVNVRSSSLTNYMQKLSIFYKRIKKGRKGRRGREEGKRAGSLGRIADCPISEYTPYPSELEKNLFICDCNCSQATNILPYLTGSLFFLRQFLDIVPASLKLTVWTG